MVMRQKGLNCWCDYKISFDLQYADKRWWRRLMGMKQILVMMAVVLVGQSVVADEKLITDPIVEKAVRKKPEKQEGELTNADLGKVV